MSTVVRVVPAALSSVTVVGPMVLNPDQECSRRWRPTFGGSPGASSTIRDLLTVDLGDGEALYAAGTFKTIGGVEASQVAKWDGTRWAPLGAGVARTPFTNVNALASFDDGNGADLIVAGEFGGAGVAPAMSVARWDGSSWSPLGAGLDNEVSALAVFDDGGGAALYAGGNFRFSGTTSVEGIAKWDGSTWTPLGAGAVLVSALEVFDDGSGPALYAAGRFSTAGGLPAHGIARWDGSAWSAVGNGSIDFVAALEVFDDGSGPALYAGGSFMTAGGTPANRVAKWDGASWSALASGMDNSVRDLRTLDDGSGPALYAGGSFTSAGGVAAVRVARWNGASWTALPEGMGSAVLALEAFDTGDGPRIHAGGSFKASGQKPYDRIAMSDGLEWSPVGRAGLDDTVKTLVTFDSGLGAELVAGGEFSTGSGESRLGIARWDGERWAGFGNGLPSGVEALVVFDDGSGSTLYAGGGFVSTGNGPAKRIARWDGVTWSKLGSGLNGEVRALTVFDDGGGEALYAGGKFSSAGGAPASNIARWDGTSWSALGGGLSGASSAGVEALTVFDDGSGPALYVGGSFTKAGGAPARRLARWDGASWSSVGPAMYGGAVEAMTVFDDGNGPALYIGGKITNAGGVVLNHLAMWTGSSWQPLGSGTDDDVLALIAFDDGSGSGSGTALYAGGVFTTAGGVAARRVARWDGTNWTGLGVGFRSSSSSVEAFAPFDNEAGPALAVGGSFQTSPARDSNMALWGCQKKTRPVQLR